jgi:hypothetical protein
MTTKKFLETLPNVRCVRSTFGEGLRYTWSHTIEFWDGTSRPMTEHEAELHWNGPESDIIMLDTYDRANAIYSGCQVCGEYHNELNDAGVCALCQVEEDKISDGSRLL